MKQGIHDPIFEYSPTLLPTMPFLRKTKCTSVTSSRRGQSGGLNFDVAEKSQVCSRTVLQAQVVWNLHNKQVFQTIQFSRRAINPLRPSLEKRVRVEERLPIHQLAERRVVCRIKGNRWRK